MMSRLLRSTKWSVSILLISMIPGKSESHMKQSSKKLKSLKQHFATCNFIPATGILLLFISFGCVSRSQTGESDATEVTTDEAASSNTSEFDSTYVVYALKNDSIMLF